MQAATAGQPLLRRDWFFFTFFYFGGYCGVFCYGYSFFSFLSYSFGSVEGRSLLLCGGYFLGYASRVSYLCFVSGLCDEGRLPFRVSLGEQGFGSSFRIISKGLRGVVR